MSQLHAPQIVKCHDLSHPQGVKEHLKALDCFGTQFSGNGNAGALSRRIHFMHDGAQPLHSPGLYEVLTVHFCTHASLILDEWILKPSFLCTLYGKVMEFENIYFEGRCVRRPISPYVYTPLDHARNELRLIRIHLGPVSSAPVKAALEHHSLLDPPAFIALSYEWGNPGEFALITLNGVEVPITRNLWIVLQQLREHRWTLLWIDALCINQRSCEERSAQILRMAAIYQEAQRVAVWLGPESKGSARETNGFMSLASALEEGKKNELQAFFDRSYWTRVWIIQEIVVGSQVSILCGHHIVEWEELSEAMATPLFKQWQQELRLKECHNLCKLRSKDIIGAPTSLLEALHASSMSQSTDPKDKVFGLLGLAFDKRVYLTEPQYDWNEGELCLRMTKSFIARKRSLDIIFIGPSKVYRSMENAGRSAWTLQLPSWCPDYIHFPSTPEMKHLISYVSGQDERFRTGTLGRRWSSTGTSVATHETFRINMHYLYVKAVPIGHIAALANVRGEFVSPRYAYRLPASSNLSSLLRLPGSKKSTGDALSRMLFLLYNKDYHRHLATRRENSQAFRSLLFKFDTDKFAYEKLKNQFSNVKKWREQNKAFSIVGKTLENRCPEYVPSSERIRPLSDSIFSDYLVKRSADDKLAMKGLVELVSDKLRKPSLDIPGSLSALADLIGEGLRLMTTSEGDVGWAHPNADLRDEIFLLPGCSMPVLLRPQSGPQPAYAVVGHAYVDGYMDGKFWKFVNSSQQQFVDLCIV